MPNTILILANSIKHGGWCVAGKDTTSRQWVRLVGDATGAALTTEETQYSTISFGNHPSRPLKKIVMNIGRHVPLLNQPENYLAMPGWAQEQGKGFDSCDLPNYQDSPNDLWGQGDRVSEHQIQNGNIRIQQSLYLIAVQNLQLNKVEDKRRATFTYNNQNYDFACTCPTFDRHKHGVTIPSCFICVSLGEAFHGYHYKIVATIF